MKIDTLYGEAYNDAIKEIAEVLNAELGTTLFSERDWARIETISLKLGVEFNEKGEIEKSLGNGKESA